MKKSMLYQSLGLALAVNLVVQTGFVSVASDFENPSQEIELSETISSDNIPKTEETEDQETENQESADRESEDDEIIVEEDSEDSEDTVEADTAESVEIDDEQAVEITDVIENDDLPEYSDDEAELLGGEVTNRITWDFSGGVLTIKGSGAMPDYIHRHTPWEDIRGSIKKVVFSGSVSAVGAYSFSDFPNLREVVFCEGMKIIKTSAFESSPLTAVTLPKSLQEIQDSAFCRCNITALTIPGNVSIMGAKAFKYNRSLSKVYIQSKALYKVGDQAFLGCAVKNVVFPAGIKTIPDFMFYNATFDGCSITIPKTVTTIGSHAFCAMHSESKGISQLAFEEGSVLTDIGASAFDSTLIKSLKLPESVKVIGGCAFARTGISEITIPSKVTNLEFNAFDGCKNLSKVTINTTSLIRVGGSVFAGCKISEVVFPKGITTIPESMFYEAGFMNCSITIPASVTTIGYAAFYANSNMNHGISELRFEKGSKLTTICGHAFNNAPIDTLVLPDSLKEIKEYAFNNTEISELVIPSKVTTISDSAFADCRYLTKVTLPASVKKIDYYAFNSRVKKQIRFFVKPGTYAYEWVKKNAEKFNFLISEAYDITYVLNGGTNNPRNPAAYEKDDYIDLLAPTRTGYTFLGWFLDKNFKKSADNPDTSKGSKLTFYAKWEARTYTVKYSGGDGAKLTGDSQIQVKYGTKYPKMLATATRNGYKFAGWYTLAEGGNKVTGGKTFFKPENPGNAVLYAHWTPVKYKITYRLNGGKLKKKTPVTYTMKEGAQLPVPAKTGYSFTGWKVITSDGKTAVAGGKTISGGNYGNVTLQATWKANVYKLIIHENKKGAADRTCSPDRLYTYEEVVKMSDVAAILKKKCGTADTDKIASFNTKANGKGKKYIMGKDYSKLSTGAAEGVSPVVTLDLYAQWRKNKKPN